MPAESVAASGVLRPQRGRRRGDVGEGGVGVGAERRHRHEPRQPQPGAPSDVLGQPEQVRTGHAAALRIAVHTVLDQARRVTTRARRCPLLRRTATSSASAKRTESTDSTCSAQRATARTLFRCSPPMRCHRGRASGRSVGDGFDLARGLLHPVLAEQVEAEVEQRGDVPGGHGLGDGHQRDLVGARAPPPRRRPRSVAGRRPACSASSARRAADTSSVAAVVCSVPMDRFSAHDRRFGARGRICVHPQSTTTPCRDPRLAARRDRRLAASRSETRRRRNGDSPSWKRRLAVSERRLAVVGTGTRRQEGSSQVMAAWRPVRPSRRWL